MRILIIGGQAAGMTAATRLKRNLPTSEITIIEKNDYISFGACGLPYYIGNEFTNESYMFARTLENIKLLGINVLISHEAVNIDYKNKVVTVKNIVIHKNIEISYDKLIIATGAYAKRITNLDYTLSNISNLTTLIEAKKIKNFIQKNENTNITIIGAGYIGLELLEAFSKYNTNINIIDSKKTIVYNLLDEEFNSVLEDNIKEYSNIKLYLDSKIKNILLVKNKYIINFENNKHLETNFIVSCIGFLPNTNIFSNIPLQKLENGAIIINKNGETNIPDIYACGDCSSIYHKILEKNVYIPLATIANKMARKIADTISKVNNKFIGTLGSSCLKILDLEIAKTGITEKEAKDNNVSYHAFFIEDYNHTNYYSNQEKIYIKILCNNNGVIIGGQIIGKNGAMLRIHALSVAIEKQLTVEELSSLDFAYAPPFTRTWEALNIAGTVASKYNKSKK